MAFFQPAISQKGKFGLGLFFGNPSSISAKYWTGDKTAIDASLGYHFGVIDNLFLNTDFLFHNWTIEAEQGILKVYCGPGAGLGFISDLSISIRAPGGIGFFLNAIPIEAFGEIVPTLQITGPTGTRFWIGAYVGARWYF